jgi:hypothetical protein
LLNERGSDSSILAVSNTIFKPFGLEEGPAAAQPGADEKNAG